MASLRGLVVDSWTGDLDFSSLPNLEWFHITEADPGQLDSLFAGHARVHHVAIGKYAERDLRALANLTALVRLELFNTRRLVSLDGAEKLAEQLRSLDLAICPKLKSLEGIGGASGLEYVGLTSCNKIEDLTPICGLDGLVALDIEMRKPPPLIPLASHPNLRFVSVIGGSRPRAEVENLLDAPSLEMVSVRRSVWLRTNGEWAMFDAYDSGMYEEQYARLEAIRSELMYL
jgi:hypothetical protein